MILDGSLKLPVSIPAKDYPLFNKLARLIGLPTNPHRCTYRVYWSKGPVEYHTQLATIPCRVAMSVAQAPYANVSIKTNVPTYIQDYIAERQTNYPGVLYQDTYIRKYALGNAGAQIFGTLGQVSQQELKYYKGAVSGDVVGQTGLEAQYNQYLQGVNGTEGVKVDSQGQFEGYAAGAKPTWGDTLKLSLNSRLQQVGQRALAESIAANSAKGADAGSFIAMDPQTGQIYAMGSAPTYNPSRVATPKEHAYLYNPHNQFPLLNRAIQTALPDGSTFKVITATAALESGNWSLSDSYDDTGKYCFQGGLMSAERRRERLRVARPGECDQGLRRRLLLQPRRPHERPCDPECAVRHQLSEGLAAAGLGQPLRDRSLHGSRSSRREPGGDRFAQAPAEPLAPGAAVRYGDGALQGTSQASSRAEPVRERNRLGRLRHRQRPNLVDR